jgi:hypothetical protein
MGHLKDRSCNGSIIFAYLVRNQQSIYITHLWSIDSSKFSLKIVLLQNGNEHPSLPVGHAVHTKETYEYLKQLLNKLEYNNYGWHICGGLKAVSVNGSPTGIYEVLPFCM